MYHYFVSYTFTSLDNHGFGFGCCEIAREKPISGITDIQEIVDELEKSNHEFKKFTVLSYQLFKEKTNTKKRRRKH